MNGVGGIEVESATVRFSGVLALEDVSLRLIPGRIIGIIGPNGAGKSTLFGVLAGTIRPDEGSVIYHSRVINNVPQYRRVREGIACSFQEVSCFAGLTVSAAMKIAASVMKRGRRVADVLDLCGLPALRDRSSGELTYGQQKLLSIALALVGEPEVLLLDEPGAGVSAGELELVLKTIRDVGATGVAIGLVDHNVSFVMNLCDEVIALDAGALIAKGTPAAIQEDPAVIACYLGGTESVGQTDEGRAGESLLGGVG